MAPASWLCALLGVGESLRALRNWLSRWEARRVQSSQDEPRRRG
jgi:hypothetical protein